MKIFCIKLLQYLIKENLDAPIRSITITDLRKALPEQERKAYSTTWRHVQRLLQNGYVESQLEDGISDLYFITEKGRKFCESLYTNNYE
ncbi:hypothetical protein LXJ15735_28020 [Lacrimispora xylanolytica]